MKKNKLLFIATLSTACLLSLASCQGAQGPKGDQGTPGINGTNGTNGKDGLNGASVLTGKGVPASSLGSNGDSYIDTDTFDFYSKKDGSWLKIGNIKGNDGDQGSQGEEGKPGKDGTKLLTGNGVPTSELGSDGDSYIDLDTFDFYSKKDGAWSKYGNMKGQDGTKGEAGEDGKTGTSVLTGKGEPASTLGNDGDSYIDTESFDFYTKADGAWSKVGNIKGDKGEQGEKGDKGNPGSQGSKGDKGNTAWSNTILPCDNGYITVNVGSATLNSEVTFTFQPDDQYCLSTYTFTGWKDTDTESGTIKVSGNQVAGQKTTVTKNMVAGGFIVAAKFTKVSNTISNDSSVDASESNPQQVAGSVAISESTSTSISLSAVGDTTISSGTMNASSTGTATLDIQNNNDTVKTVTIAKEVTISNYDLKLEDNVTLVIEEGANVTFNDVKLGNNATIKGSYKKASSDSRASLNSTFNSDGEEDSMSYDITGKVTITGKATLQNVAIKGMMEVNTADEFTMTECYYKAEGTSSRNAYLFVKSTKVTITDCEFNLCNSVYNFLEWPSGDASNKISGATITGNTFDCNGMTHNVINMFNFENNAKIDLTNNTYKNVNFKGTQPVRISNYQNAATGVTIDVSNSTITNSTKGSDPAFDTFILFQDYADLSETAQDFSTFTVIAKGDFFSNIDTTLVKINKGAYYKDLLVVYSNKHVAEAKMPKVTLTSGSIDSIGVLFSGGTGTETDPYKISSVDDWCKLAELSNTGELASKGKYFEVTSDLDFSSSLDKNLQIVEFAGNIDFNNHSVTGLEYNDKYKVSGKNYTSYTELFRDIVGKTKISNLKFEVRSKEADKVTKLIGCINSANSDAFDVELNNVVINGTANLTDNNTGLFVYWAGKSNLTLTKCVNNATIYNNNSCTGVFVGRLYSNITNPISYCQSVTFNECVNNGNIYNTGANGKVSILVSNPYSVKDQNIKITATGCVNNGNIYAPKVGNLICDGQDDNTNVTGSVTNNGSINQISVGNITISEENKYTISLDGSTATKFELIFAFNGAAERGGTGSKSFSLDSSTVNSVLARQWIDDSKVPADAQTTTETIGGVSVRVYNDKYVLDDEALTLNKQPGVSILAYDENGKIVNFYCLASNN